MVTLGDVLQTKISVSVLVRTEAAVAVVITCAPVYLLVVQRCFKLHSHRHCVATEAVTGCLLCMSWSSQASEMLAFGEGQSTANYA